MPWFGSEVCSFHWDIFTDCLATVLTQELKERIAGDASRDCSFDKNLVGVHQSSTNLWMGYFFTHNPEKVLIELVGIGIIPDEVSGTQDEEWMKCTYSHPHQILKTKNYTGES